MRADFAEKFEELIESFDSGSRKIEELSKELVKLSRNLGEEHRHVGQNMSEEELANEEANDLAIGFYPCEENRAVSVLQQVWRLWVTRAFFRPRGVAKNQFCQT